MDEDVKRWIYWAIPVIVVIGAGVAYYYNRKAHEPSPSPRRRCSRPRPPHSR